MDEDYSDLKGQKSKEEMGEDYSDLKGQKIKEEMGEDYSDLKGQKLKEEIGEDYSDLKEQKIKEEMDEDHLHLKGQKLKEEMVEDYSNFKGQKLKEEISQDYSDLKSYKLKEKMGKDYSDLERQKLKEEMGEDYSELPVHLVEKILLSLPIDSLIRSRSVSKEWNSLICSTRFVSIVCKNFPVTYFVHSDFNSLLCINSNYILYYSLLTKSGRIISMYTLSGCFPSQDVKDYYRGSAGSAILMEKRTWDKWKDQSVCKQEVYAWNPLSQGDDLFLVHSFFMVPMFSYAFIAIGIMSEREAGTYTMVAVGKDIRKKVNAIQIHHSWEKSWKTVCLLDGYARVYDGPDNMIFWKGMLFCMMKDPEGLIMVYDVQNKKKEYHLVDLPEIKENFIYYGLVACRSAVLLTGVVFDRDNDLGDFIFRPRVIIIWQLEQSLEEDGELSFDWKEIARMGMSQLRLFGSESRYVTAICRLGVGDCVCFTRTDNKCKEVVVYDLLKRSGRLFGSSMQAISSMIMS